MLKLNQNYLITTLIAFVLFIAVGLIVTSDRFNYALDYELNVLTEDCTYTKYVQDKTNCIKPEYK